MTQDTRYPQSATAAAGGVDTHAPFIRVMGTETEYGIATPSNTSLSPIVTSTHAVVAFGQLENSASGMRWDFTSEHPLRDRRGFDLKHYSTVPVVDPNALGVANVALSNGGRFYVDHAHPEYSSPECTSAFAAALYDHAGDVILNRAAQIVAELTAHNSSILDNHAPCPELKLYKNNVDGKGASYGSHENYLYSRDTDFATLAQALIPFFVARQVLVGAGRVGLGMFGEEAGFQISQRADYIEQEISLETTLNRGIINTRDEPHADANRFGRLHVIIGDANMSHISTALKLGTTALVLDAIEAGVDFSDLKLADAVTEVRAVSRDLTLTHTLKLADGRTMRALDLLREYAARVTPDEQVYPLWVETMDLLERGGYAACADRLDWCAKWALISSFLSKGLDISHPKLQLIDLQYSDINPEKSLYHALVRKQRMRTLFSPEDIEHAAWNPPEDTRAYFRGRIVSHGLGAVEAASWESVIVGGHRIEMPETTTLTKDHVGDIFDHIVSDEDLLEVLEKKGLI
ncbi:Pup deamidase/depupylase [Corynebacterium felinum]|uniref:Proteasome accessory factor A n=2 Tax=Corynebacterium felinum TaxID=131318 RepID=A0ABU2BBC0_9CORY|nr:proteasome accessory factor A [Corynebacterium felinum]WJY95007.1 Pup deamidase/depupylase [Corynebacterium felinum]